MEENCYVEPIYKNAVSAQQLQQADRATLAIWGMGCQNCATRVRNSLLPTEGVYRVPLKLSLKLAMMGGTSTALSFWQLSNASNSPLFSFSVAGCPGWTAFLVSTSFLKRKRKCLRSNGGFGAMAFKALRLY
jgi:copper chaperone CopZ